MGMNQKEQNAVYIMELEKFNDVVAAATEGVVQMEIESDNYFWTTAEDYNENNIINDIANYIGWEIDTFYVDIIKEAIIIVLK